MGVVGRFVVAAVLVLAAACTSDSGEESSVTAADVTSSSGVAAPSPTARGVTDDAITVGIAITDVSEVANIGDVVGRVEAMIAHVNDEGGAGGRRIDPVYASWGLLDTVGADAACTELTEDEQVFLVIGGMVPNFADFACYTALHETILINAAVLGADDIEKSEGRLFSTVPDETRILLAALPELADEIGDVPVAVYGNLQAEPYVDEVAEALTALGVDVAERTLQQVSYASDPVASESEIDVYVERWASSGVEWVFNVDTSVAGSLAALERSGHTDVTVVAPTTGLQVLTALGGDPGAFDSVIGVAAPLVDQLAVDGRYGIPECIEIAERAGEPVEPFPEAGAPTPLASTVAACASMDVFVALVEAAGDDLTPESFLAAGEALGPFPITGYPSGTVTAGRAHIPDAEAVVHDYDPETGAFVAR